MNDERKRAVARFSAPSYKGWGRDPVVEWNHWRVSWRQNFVTHNATGFHEWHGFKVLLQMSIMTNLTNAKKIQSFTAKSRNRAKTEKPAQSQRSCVQWRIFDYYCDIRLSLSKVWCIVEVRVIREGIILNIQSLISKGIILTSQTVWYRGYHSYYS